MSVLAASSSSLNGIYLTPRELQVATLLAQNKSYKAIGRDLGISCNTVGVYVNRAGEKLPGDGSPRVRIIIWYMKTRQA